MVCVAALLAACTPSSAPATAPATAAPPSTVTPTDPATPQVHQVVMWARGGLPAGLARRVAALQGVEDAVHLRSDTLGLVGSRTADGTAVDDLDDGWRIPVDVVAVDPETVVALLPDGPDRDAIAALKPGQVLLTDSSARLRDLEPGGGLDLAGRPGLEVAAVIGDDVLGNDEVVVHVADADDVGLEPEGSLLLRVNGDADPTLADTLTGLAPTDTPARVVGLEPGERARRTPLVLSLLEVKERFGEFAYQPRSGVREVAVDPAWMREHLVVAQVPILGNVWCHEAIIEDLRQALQAVVDAGQADSIDPGDYGGCFHPRRIGTDTTSLSHHSWGIAVDINVDMALPGLGPPPEPEVRDAFARAGFRWGGLFLSPDNHHFEWVGDAALEDPPGRIGAAAP